MSCEPLFIDLSRDSRRLVRPSGDRKRGKSDRKDRAKDPPSRWVGPDHPTHPILSPSPFPLFSLPFPGACPPPQSLQEACLLPNRLSTVITGVVMSAPPLTLGRLLGDFTALLILCILLILLILSHVPPRHPLCSLGMPQLQLQIQLRLPWTTPHRACRRDSARSRRCPRRSSRTF